MKCIYLLTGLLTSIFSISAQTSELLRGRIIGTEISVDYSTGEESQTVNTIKNVFDGNTDTYFASYIRSGGWVGMDLGEPHFITQITYSPRIDQPKRVELAIIEGANEPDFGDAVPLYLIPEPGENGVTNTVKINCSRSFRYVRYVGPNDARCNLSELGFYGYKGKGDDSKLYQPTNLPVIVIHTRNSEDIVEKELYLQGIVSIISNDGTKIYSDSLNIRGRGNNSWTHPKKPYRMKLYNKTKLLNLPAKAKNWTLINNYGDKTLMRNLLAFEISRRFDMKYTSAGTPVDVILNGEYKGCYQLCDQMEVGKGRVDITEMAPEDILQPELTGGYFIEIDAYADQEISWFKSAMKNIPVTIKSPKDDEIVKEQANYIRTYFNKLESRLFSDSYADPAEGYRSLLDTKSFLKHFLIGELCGNTDTYWSVYMYKDRNEDKFFTGPVWDFDLAFENDKRTYPISSLSDYIYRTKGSAANGMRDFVDRILNEKGSKNELSEIWSEARNNQNITVESLQTFVDSMANVLDASQTLNFKRWNIMNEIVHENPTIRGSYQKEVDAIKNYLNNRIPWLDQKAGLKEPVSNDKPNRTNGTICTASGWLILNGFTEMNHVSIYNSMGQKLAQYQLVNGNQSIQLKAGIYFIKLTNNTETGISRKIHVYE